GSPRLHKKHPASPDGHADHRTLSVVRRWRGATVAGRDATGGMSVQYAGAGVETVRAGALDATRGTQVAGRRLDLVFLLIIAAALLLRFHLAATQEYIHDENNTAIPLSKTISFAPGHLNLPIRAENHGALPAYVVKASSTLFGTTQLGYRALHVLLGIGTVIIVFLLTKQWY